MRFSYPLDGARPSFSDRPEIVVRLSDAADLPDVVRTLSERFEGHPVEKIAESLPCPGGAEVLAARLLETALEMLWAGELDVNPDTGRITKVFKL